MDNIFKPEFKKDANDFIFTNLKRKCNIAMVLVVIFVFSITTAYAGSNLNHIVICDGESKIKVFTSDITVEEAIEGQGITLSEYDVLIPDKHSLVHDGMNITINRQKKVNLISDGFNVSYFTSAKTYREFLEENNISISEKDITSINLDEILETDNTLSITRIKEFKGEISEEIPYNTTRYDDYNLEKGKTRVVQKGQNGIKKIECEIVYSDGIEVSKKINGEYIAQNPVDEVIAVGAATGNLATVGEHTFSYKKVLTCSATAYDLSFQSTGKYPGHPAYGITATGTHAKLGTVAVDPKVIPLGTKMYIVSTDGSVVYGYCTAEDTGGAIKGNKVDLFYNTTAECMQFGRRSVYVYIL